jgi:hypothetical protein
MCMIIPVGYLLLERLKLVPAPAVVAAAPAASL